jgi:hypothetical protein
VTNEGGNAVTSFALTAPQLEQLLADHPDLAAALRAWGQAWADASFDQWAKTAYPLQSHDTRAPLTLELAFLDGWLAHARAHQKEATP